MNERWMKDMQDRFADFEKPAPEGLLADVQREMQRRNLAPVEERRGRTIPMWVRVAAVAASLAAVLGIGSLFIVTSQPKQEAKLEHHVQTEQEILSEQDDKTQTFNIYNRTDLLAQQVADEPLASSAYQETALDEKEGIMPPKAVVHNEPISIFFTDDSSEKDNGQNSQLEQNEGRDELAQTLPSGSKWERGSMLKGQPKKQNRQSVKRWEVGANIAGMQGLSSPKYQYLLNSYLLSAKDMAYINANAIIANAAGDVTVNNPSAIVDAGSYDFMPAGMAANTADKITSNSSSNNSINYANTRYLNNLLYGNNFTTQMYVKAHHRLPVKIGLSLRYHFNDKWSLQAGVDYSYHSSDLVYQVANTQIKNEQKLHFLGVPIALSYSLWSPGRFNFYLTAGGEVEKIIKGSRDVMRASTNLSDMTDREDIEEKPWQFSVMGSGGVQFNVSSLFSIYAEPGVAYYFDNKSSLPTFYQEKPFNFNLNMGIRFNIYGKK